MQSAAPKAEAQKAKHYLHHLLENFGEIAISHLNQIAKSGDLNGKSPNTNILARLIEGETGADFSELDEDKAREVATKFAAKKGVRFLPPAGQEYLEVYFQDIELESSTGGGPKRDLIVEACEEILEQRDTLGI